MLVILTKGYLESNYCRTEFDYGRTEQEIERGCPYLICLIENGEVLEMINKDRLFARFFKGQTYLMMTDKNLWTKLMKCLQPLKKQVSTSGPKIFLDFQSMMNDA